MRGEEGHDIVEELAPLAGEVVVDSRAGSSTRRILSRCCATLISSLIVTGVTTEVCVHTTVREANDRGFEAGAEDCVGSYFPEFHRVALK